MEIKELIKNVITVGSKVYQVLGSGLYKNVYGECITYELLELGIKAERQKDMPLKYKKLEFESAYQVDIIVENILVVGIQPVNMPSDVYFKHIQTYAKHSNSAIGLILNFNVSDFREGIRIVQKPSPRPIVFPISFMKYYYDK